MKQTVTEYDFIDAFRDIRPDNFSYQALRLLHGWYEEYEESIGKETELDVIAICCEWSEMTISEFMEYYNLSDDELDSRDSVEEYIDYNGSSYFWVHDENLKEWRIVFTDF